LKDRGRRQEEEEEWTGTKGGSIRRQRSRAGNRIPFCPPLQHLSACGRRRVVGGRMRGGNTDVQEEVSVSILEEGGGRGCGKRLGEEGRVGTVPTIKNTSKNAALVNETMWYTIALGKFPRDRVERRGRCSCVCTQESALASTPLHSTVIVDNKSLCQRKAVSSAVSGHLYSSIPIPFSLAVRTKRSGFVLFSVVLARV
jgi:hypothetical protein